MTIDMAIRYDQKQKVIADRKAAIKKAADYRNMGSQEHPNIVRQQNPTMREYDRKVAEQKARQDRIKNSSNMLNLGSDEHPNIVPRYHPSVQEGLKRQAALDKRKASLARGYINSPEERSAWTDYKKPVSSSRSSAPPQATRPAGMQIGAGGGGSSAGAPQWAAARSNRFTGGSSSGAPRGSGISRGNMGGKGPQWARSDFEGPQWGLGRRQGPMYQIPASAMSTALRG